MLSPVLKSDTALIEHIQRRASRHALAINKLDYLEKFEVLDLRTLHRKNFVQIWLEVRKLFSGISTKFVPEICLKLCELVLEAISMPSKLDILPLLPEATILRSV